MEAGRPIAFEPAASGRGTRAFACRAWVQRLALAAAASVSFAAAAAAAVIHYETTFGPADMADFDPFGTPIQVQLPKFDTSTYDVSKLIGINVSLSTQGTAAIDVFNKQDDDAHLHLPVRRHQRRHGRAAGSHISNALTASNTTAVAVPGGSSVTILGLPVMDSTTASVAPADWAAYEGSGLLYLTLLVTNDGGTYSGTGGSGGLSYGGGAILGGTVAISYELVPEPVGVGLFGMALVGTALARRRTRRADAERRPPRASRWAPRGHPSGIRTACRRSAP